MKEKTKIKRENYKNRGIVIAQARVELEEHAQIQESNTRAFIMGYYPARILGFNKG